MSLIVRYLSSLKEVVTPAIAFLSRDRDLFAKPRIVVPSAGAKAWLENTLARRLGASGRDDGIVAGVEFVYPGAIASWLQPPRDIARPDPWSLDRLTFAVLDAIRSDTGGLFGIPGDSAREPLLAARRIAALFDEYHVRRPGMILEWERDQENPVLAPTANDTQFDEHAVPASLREGDLWQFRLWREVRRRIGADSPPKRRGVAIQDNHEPILVAGLQSLSTPQLESLELLANACDVEAYFVHPSPGLRAMAASRQQPLRVDLRDRPLQKPKEPEFPPNVDPLLPVWLAGAGELQSLLAARGTPVEDAGNSAGAAMAPAGERSLLGRLQQSILSAKPPAALADDPAQDGALDRSFLIHRCHSLSRQAEVLHDALLQAFDDLDDLQPHEIAIMSPCLEEAAPHLEAVFQRTVVGRGSDGKERRLHLPLVVADRKIRETSPAAELLVALLAIPGSRASIDDVLAVAGHPLVRAAFGINDDTVATWTDYLERTVVRWGLDADHRSRHGLTIPAHADVHTWKLGLERMLLGAIMAEAAPQADLGDVVPLDGIDPADLASITSLVRILDLIRALDAKTTEHRPAAAWCDAIEEALMGLCGEGCGELAEPLEHLGRLRAAAAGAAAEKAEVPFEDVRGLLAAWLDDMPGRQPLRTGAITATSMVPLRGVPFRVIAVIGYDDGTVGGGEADGDNLTARQQLVGDVDPRVDARRALLDCLLSAEERLLITCNGRSVKSNQKLPLVTPLAELVDFAVAHGVAREKYDGLSAVEIDHPRHHLSRRNFTPGGVVPGGGGPEVIWSHDALAMGVLAAADKRVEPIPQPPGRDSLNDKSTHPKPLIDLAMLETLVNDPLRLFVSKTLGIPAWREDNEQTPATLPLELERKRFQELVLKLLPLVVQRPEDVDAWKSAVRRSGVLPVGGMGELALLEMELLARGMASVAAAANPPVSLIGLSEPEVRLEFGHAMFATKLPSVRNFRGDDGNPEMVMILPAKGDKKSPGLPLHVAAIRLVAARAIGHAAERVSVVARHNNWFPGALTPAGHPMQPCQIRRVTLNDDVDPNERLAQWCDLAAEALQERRGLFGLRDVDPSQWNEEFDAFLAAKDYDAGTSRYPRTPEAAAYGMQPVFSEIFGEAAAERIFLERFQSLFTLETQGQTYTLQ